MDVTVNADGTVIHNWAKLKNGGPRVFKDNVTFKKWALKRLRERKEDLKLKLTP